MKRIYLFILLAITLGVFVLMKFLNATVNDKHNAPNGFNRIKAPLTVTKLAEKQFQQPVRDIAGATGDSIFIATAVPGQILLTNSRLQHEQFVNIPITANARLTSAFTTELIFPWLYVYAPNIPGIIQYNLFTHQQTVFPVKRAFSRAVMTSDHTAILRGFNEQFNDENLRKLNLVSGQSIEENGITDKTEGGGYTTDGMLHHDRTTNMLLYHHFYSNRMLYLDTNLHLLYRGAAIDTFNNYTAHAKGVTTPKGVLFTFTSPPKLLSMHSCVDNGTLFIYSRLKADNESIEQFRNHAIVDMYDIASHRYTGSLYVPTEEGKRFLKLKVHDDLLIALYSDRVVVYKMK